MLWTRSSGEVPHSFVPLQALLKSILPHGEVLQLSGKVTENKLKDPGFAPRPGQT